MEIFERVLHDGEATRGSGVFGKVESSFKVSLFLYLLLARNKGTNWVFWFLFSLFCFCLQDDSDRQLEAQWFYVPELDEDQERATLIRSMMPRPGKRSETKKYKQYYYRPLAKISRWDPEDEM